VDCGRNTLLVPPLCSSKMEVKKLEELSVHQDIAVKQLENVEHLDLFSEPLKSTVPLNIV